MKRPSPSRLDQYHSFVQAARDLGTDESEESFDRTLRKVASAPPAPMPKVKAKPRKPTRKVRAL